MELNEVTIDKDNYNLEDVDTTKVGVARKSGFSSLSVVLAAIFLSRCDFGGNKEQTSRWRRCERKREEEEGSVCVSWVSQLAGASEDADEQYVRRSDGDVRERIRETGHKAGQWTIQSTVHRERAGLLYWAHSRAEEQKTVQRGTHEVITCDGECAGIA